MAKRKLQLPDGPLDHRVATFYWDVYRRFRVERGELLFGGGLAVGNLRFDSQSTQR